MNLDNKIKARLNEVMDIDYLSIVNDTAKHVNHKNYDGGGHFKLEVVSSAFEGLSLLEQHKLVYKALEGMIKKEIHAVSLNLLTEKEYSEKSEAR